MKRSSAFSIVLSLLAFVSVAVYAQRDETRQGIEQDIEPKYEADRQKGVHAVNKGLDRWDSIDKANRALLQPFPEMSMSMQVEFPGKPKNNVTIHYYFRNYECVSVMHMQDKSPFDRNIMNYKEGSSTILMTDRKGRKTGLIMDLKNSERIMRREMEKNSRLLSSGEASFTGTDETRIIEGLSCRKYVYESPDTRSDIWLAKIPGMDDASFNNAFSSMYGNSNTLFKDLFGKAGIQGSVIQMHLYPKGKNSEECIITMKNISTATVPADMFLTTGYELTKLPGIQDMWKQSEH